MGMGEIRHNFGDVEILQSWERDESYIIRGEAKADQDSLISLTLPNPIHCIQLSNNPAIHKTPTNPRAQSDNSSLSA